MKHKNSLDLVRLQCIHVIAHYLYIAHFDQFVLDRKIVHLADPMSYYINNRFHVLKVSILLMNSKIFYNSISICN